MIDRYEFASKKIKRKKKLCEMQIELANLLRYRAIEYKQLTAIGISSANVYYLLGGRGAMKQKYIESLLQLSWPSDIEKLLQKMLECYK